MRGISTEYSPTLLAVQSVRVGVERDGRGGVGVFRTKYAPTLLAVLCVRMGMDGFIDCNAVRGRGLSHGGTLRCLLSLLSTLGAPPLFRV